MPLTQAIVAEHLDLSRQAVAALVSRLGFDLEGVDLDRLRIAYIRHLRHAAAGWGGDDIAGERLRLTAARRGRAELELRLRAGELCEVEPVRRTVAAFAAATRAAFEMIADKLAVRLAACVDEHECHTLVNAEIELVLTDLAARARVTAFGQARPHTAGMTGRAGEIADYLPAPDVDGDGA